MNGVKTRIAAPLPARTLRRPKFSARVKAPPDSSTVNFAGPQASTVAPLTRANSAVPECIVSTLPLETKRLVAPFTLVGNTPPSTDMSSPVILPTEPGGR